MQKRARERVGLVIFFALVLLGGTVLLGYFTTGLTWTVYATMLDDTVGNMGGYAAIVYPGTVQEELDAEADGDLEADADSDADDIPSFADSMGLRILSYYPGIYAEDYEGVFISDVRDLYEKKEAEVITIDALEVLRDPVPQTLRAGDRTIGIFGADAYQTKALLKSELAELRDRGSEVVVCVTRRMALLSTLEGIDVVVLTEDCGYRQTGTRVGDTLVVQAPRTGEAGVVLLSGNNVASARSIDAL